MSNSKTQNSQPDKRGGLLDDAALDAFALDGAAVQAAFAPRARRSAPAPAVENPIAPEAEGGVEGDALPEPLAQAAGPAAEPVPPSRANPGGVRPRAGVAVDIPTSPAHSVGTDPTQCTIMVEHQVRKRFAHYQTTAKVQTGWEPTNAVVVRRAFLNAKKNELWGELRERARHRQQPVSDEDFDPDGLFGDVPARRVDRGAVKNGTQQSFRPSQQELAVYDAFSNAYGFDNRSDFLNEVLNAFLPDLPANRRPGR